MSLPAVMLYSVPGNVNVPPWNDMESPGSCVVLYVPTGAISPPLLSEMPVPIRREPTSPPSTTSELPSPVFTSVNPVPPPVRYTPRVVVAIPVSAMVYSVRPKPVSISPSGSVTTR
jgi:hypothetical protein